MLRSLPGYWIPLLGAATASRDPGRILREFLRESQQAEDLRRQWRLTLAYPLLLLILAAVVIVAFSFLVIPIFRDNPLVAVHDALRGQPVVLLPDRFGKNRAVFDYTSHAYSTVHWADTPAEALERARALAKDV